MVNRVLQAKTLKLKKQRRLFPKKYSAEMLSATSVPLREFIKESSARANSGSSMFFRKRTTSAVEADEISRRLFLEAMFPSWYGHENNEPRKEVFRKISDMKSEELKDPRQEVIHKVCEMLEGVPLERNVCLHRDRCTIIRMCFSSDNKRYFLVHLDMLRGSIQVSINYGSRDRVMHVYREKTVAWKKKVFFHPETVFPPSPS